MTWRVLSTCFAAQRIIKGGEAILISINNIKMHTFQNKTPTCDHFLQKVCVSFIQASDISQIQSPYA